MLTADKLSFLRLTYEQLIRNLCDRSLIKMSEPPLIIEKEPPIAVIRLNRPSVLNALNTPLMKQLSAALKDIDTDPQIGAVVLTGNERVFSAGADIKEMVQASPTEVMTLDHLAFWDAVANFSKPLIAAVSGFALGGGFELAMNCDIIVASEGAQFGQPEINVGVMPGAGGTQRLSRTVGKFKAMEMILSGSPISAQEALRLGIVNRVVPVELYLGEAKRLAREIAEKAPLALKAAKASILKAFETSLSEGLQFERKSFFLLFSTKDQKEGMRAFLEKRKPRFIGR